MNETIRCQTLTLIASIVFPMAFPGSALCAEFSADFIRSGGGDSATSKVYLKGDLRREELFEDGEVAAVTIMRPDKGVVWTLMPGEKMYMEMPLQSGTKSGQMDMKSLEASAKMQPLGNETVSGYPCEKRRYDYNDEAMGSATVWYSAKLDYPVKIHLEGSGGDRGTTMEYRNIESAKIPDSTFEIPKGYEKFAIPGMPGGMLGMPGMGN